METDDGELPRTPERDECVKQLFGDAEANSSEYWSQSSDENITCQPFTSPPDQASDQLMSY